MAQSREIYVTIRLVMLLLCFSGTATLAHGQELPGTYRGIYTYISSHSIDSLELRTLGRHLRTLNQAYSDSLLSHIFPALEEKYQHRTAAQKAILYNTLTATAYQLTGDLHVTMRFAEEQILNYRKSGNRFRELWAFTHKMFILADMDSIELALSAALELQRKLDSNLVAPDEYADLSRQLCVFYHSIGEVENGLDACRESIAHSRKHGFKHGNSVLLETLALLTENAEGDVTEIIRIRREAMQSAIEEPDSFNLRIIYRNLANSYNRINEPDSAAKYFNLTFQLHRIHPYFFGWLADQQLYASFLIDQGQMDQAKKAIDSLGYHINENYGRQRDYYALQEYFAVASNDVTTYQKWSSKLDSINDLIQDEEKLEAREELKIQYETEKKEAENKLLKAKSHSRLIQVIALLALVLFLITLVLLVVQRRKRDKQLHTQEQRLKELELENERQEKIRITQRNDELKKDLGQRIKQVVEQQVINAELMEMVEELRTTNESPLVRKKAAQMKAHLIKSIQGQIFENIYTKMLELYPQLLKYLSEELGPDKEAELISTAMYFLGYESNVIAKVLNRSEKAIRNMRHRVRQKLGMENKDDFTAFLHRINEDLTRQ
ncbi:MAG: hypothetical protein ACPF9D_00025 [Owenweeksia sp.]